MTVPNGIPKGAPISSDEMPTVIGINFGNSFASIAVISKKGTADCIANEDGERQIACAVSFHGEEIYIGNQARPQLIKNGRNTIVGFRNLLGKKYSDLTSEEKSGNGTSAPVIEHSETSLPCYKVKVLVPSPAPINSPAPTSTAASTLVSRAGTPAVSKAPTPRSEPIPQDRIVTVNEITTMFLKSLARTAEDFLGELVAGAVISVPSWFTKEAKEALIECAKNADIKVLQLLDDAGAAASLLVDPGEVANQIRESHESLNSDRLSLFVDVGASSLTLSLISYHHGLAYKLGSSTTPVGGDNIDDKLIAWFAKEFTKKTKIPFKFPSETDADRRAEAKLRQAVEFTKRTLSASPGAASCSVESLKDGYDFTGSINRLRFDLEMRTIYSAIVDQIAALLKECGKDHIQVRELVFIGGSAALPGLREAVQLAFPEDGVHVGTYGEDTSQVIAKGCAYQAELISLAKLSNMGEELSNAFNDHNGEQSSSNLVNAPSLSKAIGVKVITGLEEEAVQSEYVHIMPAGTPLPAKRSTELYLDLASVEGEEVKVGMEIVESEEKVKVEEIKKEPKEKKEEKAEGEEEDEEEDEDEDSEPEINKTQVYSVSGLLGSLSLGMKVDRNDTLTKIWVEVLIERDGSMKVGAWQNGKEGEKTVVDVPPVAS